MEIIDAQLHLPSPAAPWRHGDAALRDLRAELLIAQLDAAGVDAAVLVSVPGMFPAEDCLAVTARHPGRFATVVQLDESAPDVAERVAAAADHPGIVGLRINTLYPPAGAGRPRGGALLAAAEKHDVPVSVLAAGNLADIAGLARAHPALSLSIDHLGLGQPPYVPADDPPWRGLPGLLALAALPNVSVRLSGAPTLSAEPYPYRDIRPYLEQIFTAFGVDRCMWGTDQHRVAGRLPGLDPLPRYAGYHSYAQGLHYLLDDAGLSRAEKTALFGGTARRVHHWDRG